MFCSGPSQAPSDVTQERVLSRARRGQRHQQGGTSWQAEGRLCKHSPPPGRGTATPTALAAPCTSPRRWAYSSPRPHYCFHVLGWTHHPSPLSTMVEGIVPDLCLTVGSYMLISLACHWTSGKHCTGEQQALDIASLRICCPRIWATVCLGSVTC